MRLQYGTNHSRASLFAAEDRLQCMKKERASFSRTLPKPYHRPKLNTRRRSAPIWTHLNSHAVQLYEIVVVFRKNDLIALMLNCLCGRGWSGIASVQFTDLCLSFCLTAFDIVKYNSPKERHKLYQITSFECKLIASDQFHGCFCTKEPGFGQRFVFISHSKFRSRGVGLR